MSLQAPATRGRNASPSAALARAFASIWEYPVAERPLCLIATILAPMLGAFVFLCIQGRLAGDVVRQFGDFYALWTSAVITREGSPALNYDDYALHARQVAMGIPNGVFNPFPYPPTLLLLLWPLGAVSAGLAFALFMIPSFALYLAAMIAGRWRDWRWTLGAAIAPATGITILSGQNGFLSAGLMIAGLRLAAERPILSGVMFGLLTFKPQLGLLVPAALIAAGLWRVIAAASATVILGVVASSLAFGPGIWGLWLHSILNYDSAFTPALQFMPTIQADAMRLGASKGLAQLLQLVVAIPVAGLVWRAFRQGPTPRAIAMLLVGTFLSTPHAFNYDMPMMTAAVIWYLGARFDASRSLAVGEIVVLALVTLLPFAMLETGKSGVVVGSAPLILLFWLIARPGRAVADATR